ncbi:twin-arginine translocation (TAT) pathway signal sequence domain protein [Escherichia coli]|nr:twin-arginine translocation (TAT) pathway signal sequence domain protein [Escherichia coli]
MVCEIDHPLWKRYADLAAGGGAWRDGLVRDPRFCRGAEGQGPMPIDIYDALAWSAITPLSEQSIAEGNRTLDFPDFTEGSARTASRSLR